VTADIALALATAALEYAAVAVSLAAGAVAQGPLDLESRQSRMCLCDACRASEAKRAIADDKPTPTTALATSTYCRASFLAVAANTRSTSMMRTHEIELAPGVKSENDGARTHAVALERDVLQRPRRCSIRNQGYMALAVMHEMRAGYSLARLMAPGRAGPGCGVEDGERTASLSAPRRVAGQSLALCRQERSGSLAVRRKTSWRWRRMKEGRKSEEKLLSSSRGLMVLAVQISGLEWTRWMRWLVAARLRGAAVGRRAPRF
jgi:hypothetical protein